MGVAGAGSSALGAVGFFAADFLAAGFFAAGFFSAGFSDDRSRPLRVATKFTRIARDYYAERSRDVDLIHLNGSIELAPILGLSDVIVDIVETGRTLRENGLVVLETVCPVSARLVANPASCHFLADEVRRLTDALAAQI